MSNVEERSLNISKVNQSSAQLSVWNIKKIRKGNAVVQWDNRGRIKERNN